MIINGARKPAAPAKPVLPPASITTRPAQQTVKQVRKPKATAPAPAVDEAKVGSWNDKLSNFYARRLQHVEKKMSLVPTGLHIPDRLSTGMLCTDFLMGGGIPAGRMVQVSGLEKGAKSTTCLHTFGQALRDNMPVIEYFDAENALDPDYTKFVTGREIGDIMGMDRVKIYDEAVIEQFYDTVRMIQRLLPDKLYHHESKTWYFVFDQDTVGRKSMGEMGFTKYDQTLFRHTGRLWCPTDMGGTQAMFFVDSYPALVTAAQDDSDEKKGQRAMEATAFSLNIRRVAGLLKRKAMSIMGVNQIRVKPDTRGHANPEYEPGGNALAFYSSIRVQHRPRSVPDGWPKGVSHDGKPVYTHGTEPSSIRPGAFDHYHYIKLKNTKNKTGYPNLEVMMRTWFSDHDNEPHGWCPVFDTYNYLVLTGRAQKARGGFLFDHPDLPDKPVSWIWFKLFVLTEVLGPKSKEVRQQAQEKLGISKIPTLRKKLFAEMKKTPTRELYVPKARGGNNEEMMAIDGDGED